MKNLIEKPCPPYPEAIVEEEENRELNFSLEEWFDFDEYRRTLIGILVREGSVKLTIHGWEEYDFIY